MLLSTCFNMFQTRYDGSWWHVFHSISMVISVISHIFLCPFRFASCQAVASQEISECSGKRLGTGSSSSSLSNPAFSKAFQRIPHILCTSISFSFPVGFDTHEAGDSCQVDAGHLSVKTLVDSQRWNFQWFRKNSDSESAVWRDVMRRRNFWGIFEHLASSCHIVVQLSTRWGGCTAPGCLCLRRGVMDQAQMATTRPESSTPSGQGFLRGSEYFRMTSNLMTRKVLGISKYL